MKVDVIVTTYNRVELLKRTMSSFFLYTNIDLVDKIIIANDGSTDGTSEYLESLRQQFPKKIKILPDQTERRGIVLRFNEALACCTSVAVCEFQDDVGFTPQWLEHQIEHLDIAHFITGFDAPEHVAFEEGPGYVIKHSSRFTQLLAKRKTWDKWFPMVPTHPFPTPTFKDGQQIGSNIDMKLSGMRKNRANGTTKFLVLPGQIDHSAEHQGSTWRPAIESKVPYTGGLKPEEVQSYWRFRCQRQGGIAVGFAGKSAPEQDAILKQKKDFILPRTDTSLRTVDYGCGVGHFSRHFDKDKYVGCDITAAFIGIAEQNNRGYRYVCLDKPYFDITTFRFDQFFTTNVLQHNSDQVVDELFQQIRRLRGRGFVFSLYENSHDFVGTKHMCFRKPKQYVEMIGKHFKVKSYTVESHVVHGEEHSLIKVYV